MYVIFQSSSEKVESSDCTTRWPDSVSCNIPMSGIYDGKYTNLMIMNSANEQEIEDWLDENIGKVRESNEEECNTIGQAIVPEGTISQIEELSGDKAYLKTYTAGEFTITLGQEWILTNTEEIV